MTLRIILLVVHVAFAALAFGAPLGVVGSARRALVRSPEALRQAAAEAARRGMIAAIGSVLTLLTGVTLIFHGGGFAVMGKNFHGALGLMLVAIVVSAAIMRPNTRRLVAAAAGDPVDRPAVERSLKRLGMGSGLLQALWLAMLIMMFVRY